MMRETLVDAPNALQLIDDLIPAHNIDGLDAALFGQQDDFLPQDTDDKGTPSGCLTSRM